MAKAKQGVEASLVTSFEQACEQRGYDAATCLPDVSMFPEKHQVALTAMAKLFIINEAMNEGHQFNWNDYDEAKWYPWFDMEETEEKGGSGFRFYGAGCDCDFSSVSSRLCYRTRAAAEHAAKTFLHLYRDMMVVNK